MSVEADLRRAVAGFACDPAGYARFALAMQPETWQADILDAIGTALQAGRSPVRVAVASGHGIGKSALVAALVHWTLATMPDARAVVTANTENQLRGKTWPEVGKWHRAAINRHWFHLSPTALAARQPGHERTWRADAVPWSERNPEAFAGLHNAGRRILLVFDEAAAIPDAIWDTAEGALTDPDTEIVWCVFGNPTRNSGRFHTCFGARKGRWIVRQIDSRKVARVNRGQIDQWVEDYGEDSDFVRVRVRGVFPRAGHRQFIAADLVEAARTRVTEPDPNAPLVVGVDVARFGDDQSVMLARRGRKVVDIQRMRGLDTWRVAQEVARYAQDIHPDAIHVDGGGVGAGVVDNLRQMKVPVVEVLFGQSPLRPAEYANRRAEMWGEMRKWLDGADLPDDPELLADLTGPEYGFRREGVIQLERKDDMKRRGLASPDSADALALTFAQPVLRRTAGPAGVVQAETGYDIW